MRKLKIALLAIALSVPALAFAQSSQDQQATPDQVQRQQANQAAMNQVDGMNTSAHQTMTGMVSSDGKQFTSNNTTYQISNPGALKNYENQNVTIKFQMKTGSNMLKIDKVMPSQSGQ